MPFGPIWTFLTDQKGFNNSVEGRGTERGTDGTTIEGERRQVGGRCAVCCVTLDGNLMRACSLSGICAEHRMMADEKRNIIMF